MKGRAWTAEEDGVLRASSHLTAQELAHIVGRTPSAVQTRRLRIGAYPARDGDKANRKPYAIGRRTVVAKTCTACGLLLDAEWYGKASDSRWESRCRSCRTRSHNVDGQREWRRLAQRATESAGRASYEWTDTDLEILQRPDLTLAEMASALQRTYIAVMNARSYFGIARETPRLGAPQEKWKISNPS